MGIPGSPYSRDFGDPVVIIGTPFAGDAVRVDTDSSYGFSSQDVSSARWVSIKWKYQAGGEHKPERGWAWEVEREVKSRNPRRKAPTDDSRSTLSSPSAWDSVAIAIKYINRRNSVWQDLFIIEIGNREGEVLLLFLFFIHVHVPLLFHLHLYM